MQFQWSLAHMTLHKGIDFNVLDQNGQTAFVWACQFAIDHQEFMGQFLDPVMVLLHEPKRFIDFNFACGPKARTGLHIAAQSGLVPLVKAILSHAKGLNINLKDVNGLTGFHLACAYNFAPDVVRILLQDPRHSGHNS